MNINMENTNAHCTLMSTVWAFCLNKRMFGYQLVHSSFTIHPGLQLSGTVSTFFKFTKHLLFINSVLCSYELLYKNKGLSSQCTIFKGPIHKFQHKVCPSKSFSFKIKKTLNEITDVIATVAFTVLPGLF